MSICALELQREVIAPTLDWLGCATTELEQLLLGTAACESALGFHARCTRTGGLGLYRITPEIHRLVWDKCLVRNPELASKVRGLASQHAFLKDPDKELQNNLGYASAIALTIYHPSCTGMPSIKPGLTQLAHLWSQSFDNGTGDRREQHEFIKAFHKWVLRDIPLWAA